MFNQKYTAPTQVKIVQSLIPHVYISTEALMNMQLYVQGCADEIGWLGTAYKHGKDLHIEKVYLFEQQVHATTTEITPDGLGAFGEAILANPHVDGMEIWNNLKMWGHSHVHMAVNPSGQDDKQMETFANSGHDWFIRLIANKKGDMRIDLYDYTVGVAYNDLPWTEKPSGEELALLTYIEQLKQEIDQRKLNAIAEMKPFVTEEITQKVRKIVHNTTTYINRGTVTPHVAHQAYRQQQIADQVDKKLGQDEKKNSLDSTNSRKENASKIVGDEGLDYWIHLNFGTSDLDDLMMYDSPEILQEAMWEDYGVMADAETIAGFFKFLGARVIRQMSWADDQHYGGMYSWET